MGGAVDALRRVDWRRLGVEWVVLFGSSARGRGRDFDLLVMAGDAEALVAAALAASEALGVDPDRVDVVRAASAPCVIVLDAWKRGVVVYEEERGAAREWLASRVMVCWDYSVWRRRLKVVETAIESAVRRWGSWGSSRG